MERLTTNWITLSTRPSGGTLIMSKLDVPRLFELPDGDSPAEPRPTFPGRLLLWMSLVPLAVVLIVTLVCNVTKLDLHFTDHFYLNEAKLFPFQGSFWAELIYIYGPKPALVLSIGALVVFFAGFVFHDLRRWRLWTLFIALAVTIGPGILINGVLKPFWGRPRPADIVAFGGHHQYVPPAVIGPYEMAMSFPSGHASMGFVFMLPGFLLLRRYKMAAASVFLLGMFLGGLVGLSRVAEGRHFLSDIVWSGAIVYFTGLALYVVMNLWEVDARQESIAREPGTALPPVGKTEHWESKSAPDHAAA